MGPNHTVRWSMAFSVYFCFLILLMMLIQQKQKIIIIIKERIKSHLGLLFVILLKIIVGGKRERKEMKSIVWLR
jgi:hypothetical protein